MFYVQGTRTNVYCLSTVCLMMRTRTPSLACISLLCVYTSCIFNCFSAAEVNISNLTLASRTATTLSVTWSAGYPKCYSFTVSHSTQDGSITVTQPADSDTSHTLTSLQPGTTYRIEVVAVRKGNGADGQKAKVMGNFTTEGEGEEILMLQSLMQFVAASVTIRACGCSRCKFHEGEYD